MQKMIEYFCQHAGTRRQQVDFASETRRNRHGCPAGIYAEGNLHTRVCKLCKKLTLKFVNTLEAAETYTHTHTHTHTHR